MYFTILTAISPKNWSLILDLSKSGNKYIVSIWDRGEHKTTHSETFLHYEEAEGCFNALADSRGFTITKEVDTSDAYAYIDSQYA